MNAGALADKAERQGTLCALRAWAAHLGLGAPRLHLRLRLPQLGLQRGDLDLLPPQHPPQLLWGGGAHWKALREYT